MNPAIYRRLVAFVYGVVTWAVLIGLWELAAIYNTDSNLTRVFPPPSQFMATLFKSELQIGIGSQAATLWQSILSTLYRVFSGLTLGFVASLLCGILVSTSQISRRIVSPVIQVLAPIAPIAWIPLALTLFGIGNQTAIFLVFMGVFFTLTIATMAQIETVPTQYQHVAKLFGLNKFQIWLSVVLPHILPSVFTMLRLNFIAAWMAVLAAEMTGLGDGLGAVIMVGRNLFNADLILIGMFLIGFFGFVVDTLLLQIQKHFFWWGRYAKT